MAEPDTATLTSPAGESTVNPPADANRRSAFPQFAIDAANERLGSIGGALGGAADAIDDLFERDALPFGEGFTSFAAGAVRRLRSTGESISDQDAADLLARAQRSAAERPALAIGAGAALGAALAFILVRMAPRAATPAPAGDAA